MQTETRQDSFIKDTSCLLYTSSEELTVDLLKEAKRIEFPDNVIAELTGKTEEEIKQMRYRCV